MSSAISANTWINAHWRREKAKNPSAKENNTIFLVTIAAANKPIEHKIPNIKRITANIFSVPNAVESDLFSEEGACTDVESDFFSEEGACTDEEVLSIGLFSLHSTHNPSSEYVIALHCMQFVFFIFASIEILAVNYLVMAIPSKSLASPIPPALTTLAYPSPSIIFFALPERLPLLQ